MFYFKFIISTLYIAVLFFPCELFTLPSINIARRKILLTINMRGVFGAFYSFLPKKILPFVDCPQLKQP